MSEIYKINISTSCILNIPFQTYGTDFTFIVNGEEFQTSRLISDLLSPVICRIHSSEPTIDTFTINTSQRGDFSRILNLFNFQQITIPTSEVPFFLEVIELLGNESIECREANNSVEITCDNVLMFIKQHEKYEKFYSKRLSTEIDFISSHFFEICETQGEEMRDISIDTLMRILRNDHFVLKSEDQLLSFINGLYASDSKYSILYETVLFENVESEKMKEFTAIYNSDDMSRGTWLRLSKRLEGNIEVKEREKTNSRYRETKKPGREFKPAGENEMKGIVNFLHTQSNGKIENEINITASSIGTSSSDRQPRCVALLDDKSQGFFSRDEPNSWFCYDFKDRRIIPTYYTIMSICWRQNDQHPKSWVIECSNDKSSWEIVDEERDCSFLNGNNVIHTFKMNHENSKEFQYIRMRLTGPNWYNNNRLSIGSFEIYGRLI